MSPMEPIVQPDGTLAPPTPTTAMLTALESAQVASIPVACPYCGWDAHGELAIRDWWNDAYPPGPKSAAQFGSLVLDDGDDESGHGPECECPCGEWLSIDNVVLR